MINAYRTVSSRISTFFVEGERHVFLGYESYASVVSDTGVLLGEFLAKWLLPHDDPSVSPAPVPGTTPAPIQGQTPAPASSEPTSTPTVAPTPASRPAC